jgi:hypothetical protein
VKKAQTDDDRVCATGSRVAACPDPLRSSFGAISCRYRNLARGSSGRMGCTHRPSMRHWRSAGRNWGKVRWSSRRCWTGRRCARPAGTPIPHAVRGVVAGSFAAGSSCPPADHPLRRACGRRWHDQRTRRARSAGREECSALAPCSAWRRGTQDNSAGLGPTLCLPLPRALRRSAAIDAPVRG